MNRDLELENERLMALHWCHPKELTATRVVDLFILLTHIVEHDEGMGMILWPRTLCLEIPSFWKRLGIDHSRDHDKKLYLYEGGECKAVSLYQKDQDTEIRTSRLYRRMFNRDEAMLRVRRWATAIGVHVGVRDEEFLLNVVREALRNMKQLPPKA